MPRSKNALRNIAKSPQTIRTSVDPNPSDHLNSNMEPSWVRKRTLTEANLAADIDYIWRDVKQSLEDSARDFRSDYDGNVECRSVNDHRFRMTYLFEEQTDRMTRNHKVEVDIDFDKTARTLRAESASDSKTVRHLPLVFAICADHLSAFLCDKDDNKVTAEKFAQLVLEPVFFPKTDHSGFKTTRII
jgi:hypothetical protein